MACKRVKFPFTFPNQKIINLPVVIFFQLEVDNSELNGVWKQPTCNSFLIPLLIIVGIFVTFLLNVILIKMWHENTNVSYNGTCNFSKKD